MATDVFYKCLIVWIRKDTTVGQENLKIQELKKKNLSQNYKAAGGHFLVWYSSKFLII